ncbi:MAG: DegT/DnrJ/EryC1/StrS family aminotransferase [Planctomycetes bacterium]|nr:DegT/DnrJ/EryC1/StrS family aminotransferase [Planctomycetota bacterium]
MTDTLLPAIAGGPKAKSSPYSSGSRFGPEELHHLKQALDQNTLFYARGAKVRELCVEFARIHGVRHCIATSSGTASIHVALGALDVGVGDEVIVPPITDQGTIIGVLLQNALPVFCDVLPESFSYDPADLERKISPRTAAVVAVHLTGSPNDMDVIFDITRPRNIPVVEDCAQAYLAEYKGRLVGTMGAVGAFSLNDFKHISAGDGGLVLTDDDELAARSALFADKWYDRSAGRSGWSLAMLAPNYRMNELTGAVGLAQLARLPGIVARRREIGAAYDSAVSGVEGLFPVVPPAGGVSSYWFYMLRVDEALLGASRDSVVEALVAEGVPAWGPYTTRVKYLEPMFQELRAYPKSHFPFDNPVYGKVEYRPGLCPNSEKAVDSTFIIPVSEFHSDLDVQETASAITRVGLYFNARRQPSGKE